MPTSDAEHRAAMIWQRSFDHYYSTFVEPEVSYIGVCDCCDRVLTLALFPDGTALCADCLNALRLD